MAFRFTQTDWDQLLDGAEHLVDLDLIGFEGGLAGFRALVYYQADKRRGTAKTRKVSATALAISSAGCQPLAQLRATMPPTFVPGARPAPQEQPPAFHVDDIDDEALLGPCTCGQSPTCLPSCARVAG
jgi:hypothetical protein